MAKDQYCMTNVRWFCVRLSYLVKHMPTRKQRAIHQYKWNQKDQEKVENLVSKYVEFTSLLIHEFNTFWKLWRYILLDRFRFAFKLEWDCWSGPQTKQNSPPLYVIIERNFRNHSCFILQVVFWNLVITNPAVSFIYLVTLKTSATASMTLNFRNVEIFYASLCSIGIIAWYSLS